MEWERKKGVSRGKTDAGRRRRGPTERVDAPDASLGEDLVLVEDDEGSCGRAILVSIARPTALIRPQSPNSPRVLGVSFWKRIELVGLLPSKTFDLSSASLLFCSPNS
jgi:hypothetical protein